ncbi:muscle, skeletal receptor tyrosine protein kinase [Plakobranchus ocellatus]|uniref:receptor protein-tyrosine kinase n=1 Tax=Plakobranchus ocellatus TaxID=259542 RepID=A0AAV3ZN91_9GAST|nr:muscle, skeletal receptor tyrosine protein kinase [Plakobranchus ocellatus]
MALLRSACRVVVNGVDLILVSLVLIFGLFTDHALLTFASTDALISTINSQQTCRPYIGKFCRGYLGSSPVLTPMTPGRNATPAEAMIDLDLVLGQHLRELKNQGLFSNRLGQGICLEPARRIICHLSFPTCILPETDVDTDEKNQRKPSTEMREIPLPVCRESCQAVSQLFCFRQLSQLQLLKEKGILTGKLGLLGMPDCSTLPSKWDHAPSGHARVCIESDHHDYALDKVTDTCYVERGRWYNGTVSVTRRGHACQPWNEATPHRHNRSALIYPELEGASNYCRNPGGEEPSPWCYTTDPTIRFDLCDIRPCGLASGEDENPDGGAGDPDGGTGDGGSGESEDDGGDGGHSFQMLLVIIVVPCVLVLVIFTTVMLCLCCRRSKYRSAPGEDVDVDVDGLTVNSAYYMLTRLNPKLEAIEFPRNDLVFVERIGQGAFGMVFKARILCSNGNSRLGGVSSGMLGNKLSSSKQSLGFGDSKLGKHHRNPFSSKGDLHQIEFHDPVGKYSCDSKLLSGDHIGSDHQIWTKGESDMGGGEGQIVAVKMLKEDASESVQADFEREASLMVEFEHENILKLLGVCTTGRPMCLLFEYMSHGDLNDYLQLCSPDRCLMRPLPSPSTTATSPPDSSTPPIVSVRTPRGDSSHRLDTADHLHISRQVCSGMVYLSDRGYVHRDLATRNCLVSDGLTVKISDFGLARSVHSMDYYRGSDRDAVPIRWMPPEAILYNKFSSQSDVWSFGVLLWEVFSYAFQPYYGLTHEQVIAALRSGRTLGPPEDAPPAVYSLMKSCWRTKPSSRPSFSSLHKCLVSMHEEACRAKAGVGSTKCL